MDALSAKQLSVAKEIAQLLSNTKKDSKERKDAIYANKKLDTLKNLWDEYVARHNEMEELGEFNHEYFKQKLHEQTKAKAIELKGLLQSYALKTPGQVPRATEDSASGSSETFPTEMTKRSATPVPTSEDSSYCTSPQVLNIVKKLNYRLDSVKEQIDKILYDYSDNLAVIQFQSKTLSDDWKNIEALYEELLVESDDVPPSISAEVQGTKTKISNVLMKCEIRKAEFKPCENDIRLPRLSIPIFDGKAEAWSAFHDIFMRLIHNNKKLANIEKMQYLKTHLKGEAVRLLSHLEISDVNYDTALRLLTERFHNKRKLISSHIQALWSLPKLDTESMNGIRRVLDTVRENVYAITNLGVDTSSWAPFIVHLVLQKVDPETHRLFEQTLCNPKDIPTFETLYSFLESRFQSLEAVGHANRREFQPNKQGGGKSFTRGYKSTIRNYVSTTSGKCRYCQKPHIIYSCPEFQALNTTQRNSYISKNKICTNCLNHNAKDKCKSQHKYAICQQRHHTLLHSEQKSGVAQVNSVAETQSHFAKQNNSVLLATAMIKAKAADGRTELLRALIDPGSQSSFVTEHAAQLLAASRLKTYAKIAGIGGTDAGTAQYKANLIIKPRFPSEFSLAIDALILPNLTKLLPNDRVRLTVPWENRIAADPTYNKPGPVDVILGAEVYGNILSDGMCKLHPGMVMQETELGWILTGQTEKNIHRFSYTTSCLIASTDINATLQKFWELEEVSTSRTPNPQDECERHFSETHSRNGDGTYTVRIPFKSEKQPLGDSKKKALARFLQIENKWKNDSERADEYRKFMREYISLGHMAPVNPCESPIEDVYYMPHQAVIKEDSSTTKLRVVFDASSKTSTGVSLNDNMLIGSRIQANLSDIILRGRKYKYLFTADIEKMYRQIKINERDQDYQRILWRFTPNEPIKEYRLTTVTYGTAAAPYLAIRTIQQLAKDEQHTYPHASKVLLEDFYVDDVMSGTYTLHEANIIIKELIEIMRSGGFSLRKWICNHTEVLKNIPEDKREKGILEISDDRVIKTLGIRWSPRKDTFQFKVQRPSISTTPTKRTMLSETAKIFDPLGWLTPVTVKAKMMLQELWIAGMNWDTPLPTELGTKWSKYRSNLATLEEIMIPRWIQSRSNNEVVELHGFCDASEKAFAAVVYSRITTKAGDVIVSLLTAKSKVTPIKSRATIPKLELCAALLLAKLMQNTQKCLDLHNIKSYYWSDSQIVLAWIKGDSHRWENFVANRVTQIQEMTTAENWQYVNTSQNPADCASRGIEPNQLKDHSLWWTGPVWLKLSNKIWPATPIDNPIEAETPQIKTMSITVSTGEFERFSTYKKLVRVMGHVFRFIESCRKRKIVSSKQITAQELEQAARKVILLTQLKEFQEEIRALKSKNIVPPKKQTKATEPIFG